MEVPWRAGGGRRSRAEETPSEFSDCRLKPGVDDEYVEEVWKMCGVVVTVRFATST